MGNEGVRGNVGGSESTYDIKYDEDSRQVKEKNEKLALTVPGLVLIPRPSC